MGTSPLRRSGCGRDGRLDETRLESYRKLGEELAGQPSEAERREAKRQFSRRSRSRLTHARGARTMAGGIAEAGPLTRTSGPPTLSQ